MFKALFVGIWVAGLLSGSVYLFSTAPSGEEEKTTVEKVSDYFGGLESINLGGFNVTVIRDNEIKGYLIIDSVLTVKKADMGEASVPLQYLLKDLMITALHNNEDLDIYRLDKFNVKDFQENITMMLNKKLGKEAVKDVLIQQIDYLSKEDIRDLNLRRN